MKESLIYFPVLLIISCPTSDRKSGLADSEAIRGFADAMNSDFHFNPGARLFEQTGFRPITVDEIRLYNDEYRASWPVDADQRM